MVRGTEQSRLRLYTQAKGRENRPVLSNHKQVTEVGPISRQEAKRLFIELLYFGRHAG